VSSGRRSRARPPGPHAGAAGGGDGSAGAPGHMLHVEGCAPTGSSRPGCRSMWWRKATVP